jgi:bifunctional DNA-binding transcriptional regulator/antitoxin component of YhaV-PrlF toxin-antitoxin module
MQKNVRHVMSETIRLRKRGVLTLPKHLREAHDLNEGDALHLVDLGGVFALTPLRPMVSELAREIERLREEADLSTEELLEELREERQRYAQEHYEKLLGKD